MPAGRACAAWGTDSIRISGRDAPLHGCTYAPLPDRICAGTLLCGAAITGGDVYVRDAREQDLSALLHKLRETGCEIHLPQGGGVRAIAPKRLRAVRRIETAPFPGFPTDMQAQMSAVLTRARGTSVVVENVFENRMGYAAELCRMGADIQISGRTAVIPGREGAGRRKGVRAGSARRRGAVFGGAGGAGRKPGRGRGADRPRT